MLVRSDEAECFFSALATPAEAGVDECGGIHVETDAGCALSVGDECIFSALWRRCLS